MLQMTAQEITGSVVKYRKLGNTGFDVSSIGFGLWQIGGGRWTTGSEEECIKLLKNSLDMGINIYDAAVVYGQYLDANSCLQSRSQELLGKAFHNCRDQVYYCIKLGQYDELSHRSLFEPGRLVEQFQQSLRRLHTDYIDICLIHAPSLHDVKLGSAISVLKTLQALGLIRAIGYSFENEPEHVLAALEQRVDVIMLQYNLIDQQCAEVLQKSEEYGVGILVGGPFKRGYLTGRFKKIEDLPMDDHYWWFNVNKNSGKVKYILDSVNQLIEEYKTDQQLRKEALAFILRQKSVSSAIIGHRAIHEVKENILAVNDFLEKNILETIDNPDMSEVNLS